MNKDTSIIDRLFLELSQFTQAKTDRERLLEDLLWSAHSIAARRGEDTAWGRFSERLCEAGIGKTTARTFRKLPGDE
jgi:hypothetical protein